MTTVPTIVGDKYLSLDDRLKAVRKPVKGSGWEARLDALPTHLHVEYSMEGAVPQLCMTLNFSQVDGEPRHQATVSTQADEKVKIQVGKMSGRIYEVALFGVKLTNQSAEHFVRGMMHCIREEVTDDVACPPSKAATALATADLVREALLEQVEIIRKKVNSPS